MIQYFWWASLSSRFTSGSEGKIAADLKRMDRILKEKQPSYKGEECDIAIDDLEWRWFSAGDAFCKAILCLYAYFQPKDFDSGGLVTLDNSWLKQANSKNYHHFFPKSYLKNNGWDTSDANCILNITLVGDNLNKHKIRAQAPKKYMKQFKKVNPNLAKIMKTHLVDNLDGFGIWDNDYEKFIIQRAKKVLKELQKRLHPQL